MRWLVALVAVMLPNPAAASARWAAELRLGAAWNLPVPVTIRQEGAPVLRIEAGLDTRALEPPLYYSARVARWDGARAWALDLTHHKLHLTDSPPEVGAFSISHGYNLVTVQRLARRFPRVVVGAGAGMVIAHPESEVRGRRLDERRGMLGTGYYVAGPVLGASLGLGPSEAGRLFLAAEIRATLAYARVPIAGGSASVPNAALHLTLGLGWAGSPRSLGAISCEPAPRSPATPPGR